MKLKFKNQKFQTDAAKAVTDVFKQQRRSDMQEYHNLTIATIAKLSVALDDDIITTTANASQRVAYDLGETDAKCSYVADDSTACF